MVERIRQILQDRQLSPTQFADALGLARPIISHVLSGRNKPSLEVVQKIIAAFPDLSLPWLLSGQGPMLASASAQPSAPAVAPVNQVTDDTPQRPKRSSSRATEPAIPPSPSLVVPPAPAPDPAPEPVVAQSAAPVAEVPPAPTVAVTASQKAPQAVSNPVPPSSPDLLSAFAEPGKTIRRIVIFYHDGTFSAYQPETPS